MAAAIEMPRGIRINVVSPTVFEESMEAYGPFFRGFDPVPVARAARAFSRSVEGLETGQDLPGGLTPHAMKALLVYVALTALTLAVFASGPISTSSSRISSMTAAASSGMTGSTRFGRDFFRVTPFVVLALYAAPVAAPSAAASPCPGRRAAGR